MNLALHKRRLVIALAVTGISFLVALGAIVFGVMNGLEWPSLVAVAAIVLGLAAQIWFIVGVAREKPRP